MTEPLTPDRDVFKRLTPAAHKERDMLSEDLRPHFDALYAQYRFRAFCHTGRAMSHAGVIADLIRDGWRDTDA